MGSNGSPGSLSSLLEMFGMYSDGPDSSWNAANAMLNNGIDFKDFMGMFLTNKYKPEELKNQRYQADAAVRAAQAKGQSDLAGDAMRNNTALQTAQIGQDTALQNQRIQQAIHAMTNQATLGAAGMKSQADIEAAKLANQGRVDAARIAAGPKESVASLLGIKDFSTASQQLQRMMGNPESIRNMLFLLGDRDSATNALRNLQAEQTAKVNKPSWFSNWMRSGYQPRANEDRLDMLYGGGM